MKFRRFHQQTQNFDDILVGVLSAIIRTGVRCMDITANLRVNHLYRKVSPK